MKRFVRLFSFCCLMWVCYSCSSIVPLQLDTVRPARVSYKQSYPPLAVVCNAPVPDVSEYSRYIDANGKQYRMDFAGDSIPGFFTMSLASLLYESACFDSVWTLFPDSTAITGLAGLPISEVMMWREENPNAVLLSVDDIRPVARFYVEPFEGVFGVGMEIASSATVQCYIPGESPVTESVVDTLMWYAYGSSPEEARVQLPAFEMCLEEALSSLSSFVAERFVPHVQQVERYIFITSHPAMGDAYKYWKNTQYTEASYLWEYVYEKAENVGRRARAAANLALFYELKDDYKTALTYARAAHNLFMENNDVAEAAYAASYAADLESRLADTLLLDTQWGE